MNIKNKDTEGVNISINTDKKNYLNLIRDIKILGKKYENLSNVNNLKYSTVVNFQRKPFMRVAGWCSRVIDDNGKVSEVFFGDYDNCLFRIVESEMKYIMEEYNMPPVMIFKSSKTSESIDNNGEVYGNYLVISLGKNSFRDVVKMQNELHIDEAFKNVKLVYRFKTAVLRLGPKGKKSAPVFKCIIGDLNKEYNKESSKAHLDVLKELYPEIPYVKYTNLDNGDKSKLYVAEYTTAST